MFAVRKWGLDCCFLALQIGGERFGCPVAHVVMLTECLLKFRGVQLAVGLFQELADFLREVKGAVHFFGPPERDQGVAFIDPRHFHIVVGDALDAPDLVAKGEGIAQ